MAGALRSHEPTLYRIKVQGMLDSSWSDWFDGLTVKPTAAGETVLTGPVRDQTALHGLLNKIRDLGLPLLSVEQLECSGGGEVEKRFCYPASVLTKTAPKGADND